MTPKRPFPYWIVFCFLGRILLEFGDLILDTNLFHIMQKMNFASHLVNVLQFAEHSLSAAYHEERMDDFYTISVKLYSIFGDVIVDGLNIAENGIVRIVRDENSLCPRIYEVRAYVPFSLYVFCMRTTLTWLCQHFIAVIFARACGLLKPERVEKMEVMRAILSVVSKPNEVDPGFKREEEEHINSASQDDLVGGGGHTDHLDGLLF